MKDDANQHPIGLIYRSIHRAVREATEPHIHQSNQATGTGKTYQALMTSVEALEQAKAAGESLIVVYVAPQHRHIPFENRAGRHPSGSPQALLAAADIPAVKVNSRTLLTDPEEAHNLYQDLNQTERHLKSSYDDKAAPSLVRCLQQLLYQFQSPQTVEQELPENALDITRSLIQRQQKTLGRLRQEGFTEAELERNLERLQHAHDRLFSELQRAVDVALKQSTLDGKTLESVLGHKALVAPFRFFQRQLFPWYEVVRRPGGPLGMVAMTASRLMTRHRFPCPRRALASADKGDFTTTQCYVEDAIHGAGAGSDVSGLNEGRTRFLLLLDESDEVKQVLNQAASVGKTARRRYLSGMLLDQARATQIGNTLLNEMPLVFCTAAHRDAVWEGYKALEEAHPGLVGHNEATTPDKVEKLRPLPPEAELALRQHQRRHKLGTGSPAHHLQQLRLRERLVELIDRQYCEHAVIHGSGEDKLGLFVRQLKAFCQRVSWINLNLGDPTVAAAGSTGTFTAGSWAFVNLDDERLAGLLAHRDSADVNELDIISEAFLHRSGGETSGTTFALADSFELMLTLTGLVHLMENTAEQRAFRLLKAPYRGNNRTSSAPLTEMLERLAGVQMRELMTARRDLAPGAVIDDDIAFRFPHLIMQWVPDFARRFVPGAPGESVVPAIGFRAWSAEHHLEQLISPQAYAFSRPDMADSVSGRQRPAHSLVLISATGGFAATHLGGFAGAMLAHSRFVRYVPMSKADLELARQARDIRHQGQDGKSGRPKPCVAQLPEHAGLLAEDARGPLLVELDETLAQTTTNSFKRRETRRVVELITLLGHAPRRIAPDTMSTADIHGAVQPALVENAEPCMALMLIQSLKTPVAVLKQLCGKRLTSIIDGHLYGYDTGRRDGSRPVLLVTYYSGRESGTDARINQMLRGEGSGSQQERQTFAQFLQRANPALDLARAFPAEDASGTPQQYAATDLLRRDMGYHAAIITAFQSAGLGLNFKVDTHLGRDGERDVDMLVLGMSPHFTAARPRFERYQGPPGERQPEEPQFKRDSRGEHNRRAFVHNNRVIHGVALTGMELAARLNQQRWGREEDMPARHYRARHIRLHPDSYLAAFPAFLREQHVVDLARTVFQAAGRGERTQAAQPQTLLVCDEIITDLVAADPYLYGDDGHGGSRADQQHAASLNSLALMEYARRYRRRMYGYPAPEDRAAAEVQLRQAEQAFSDNPAVPGFKNRLLQRIKQMQAGELASSEAAELIRQWEAWRDPALLFAQTRKAYRHQALAAGVPEKILALMWWPLSANCRLPVYKGANGYAGIALVPPHDDEADNATPYPHAAQGFRLPSDMLQHMQRHGIAHPDWTAPTLHDVDNASVLHPILEPDANGIWGELALDGWFADVKAELAGAERLSGIDTQRIYELFDRYWRCRAADGEYVLIALDAKHYARATDRRLGTAVSDDAQGKQDAVRRWAREHGYGRTVMAYVNTRPCPQEEARAGIQRADLLSFSAFVRTLPTDVNAPRDVSFAETSVPSGTPLESPLLAVNPVAAERLLAAVQGDIP
ncbi:hypothetical protein [Vreelandella jeotgali]|uniref:hypothetical protein n=1 Tax=Vreelandella jeotgali TaxID=553386 RepID=UPI00034D12EA|nr:hypothetical protein [Halomonas jeotgali]